MSRMVIVEGVRTAIGRMGDGLKDVPANMMLAVCFEEVIKRSGINPLIISEVIAGNICSPSDAPNIARVAALRAGIPNEVPAKTVARNCASGIEAITQACQAFAAGDGDVFLVGGTENMSQVPYLLKQARSGQKLQHHVIVDGLWEGLEDPIIGQIMGRTAENVAKKWEISREDQDAFAINSHKKALAARVEGKFRSQIVPIPIASRMRVGEKTFGSEIVFADDECISSKPDKQKLSLLPAIFMNEHISDPQYSKPEYKDGKIILERKIANEGTVTPGNSCPMSDGAAALLLMSEEKAKELGLIPMAYIVSYAYSGCDPAFMGEGPIYAVPKALSRAGLKIEDIDFFELNEAFAAQSIACQRALKIPEDKLNVWGGAIALGHPVGATGSILTVKAMHILEENQKKYAAITMCVGGGQGGCLIIERAVTEKKLVESSKAIRSVAVIGGGAMGRGIAMLIAQKETPVVIKEVSSELAEKSLSAVREKLDSAASRGKIMKDKAEIAKSLITATASVADITKSDLVIEAVFENMELKRQIFKELDDILLSDAIFATNTSSLSIDEIASVSLWPERFVGMHFFNPPLTMPLVELISGNKTSESTVSAVEEFAKNSLGKITIRVKNCPAFLVNRLLVPYLNEAVILLTETTLGVEEIDAAASKFGWPMGPFALLDYLGIEVATEVADICHKGYGERAKAAPLMKRLVGLGRFGVKSGAGFYVHDDTKGFEKLSDILSREYPNRSRLDLQTGFRRMMLGMVNEAFLCLEEGISSAEEIETGCRYGIGFPLALEGPLHWAQNEGLSKILTDLSTFEKEYGMRFKPSSLLASYANENRTIFESW